MYFQRKTCVLQFGRALTQNSWICPIMSYLWMVGLVMRLFPAGPTLEDHASIQPKKVQPIGFYFWHLHLGLFKSLFLVGEAEHMRLWPIARTDVCSAKKTCVSQIGRALTQDSWICPIMSYLWMVGLMMRLFPAGPTFEDHPHVFSQKKVQPLGFYFWHLRLGLFKSRFLVGEAKHMCLYPFAGIVVFSTKNMYFAIWARWHKVLEFVPSCPSYGLLAWWCDFFPAGPTFEDHPHVFSQKKGPAPWILFLTLAPRPLQVTVSMFVKMIISIRTLLQGQMYLQ